MKARYLIPMAERKIDAKAVKDRAEACPDIIFLAKRRKRYGFDERWWAVGAGIGIVLLLIAYSVRLTVVAGIIAILLALFMGFVMAMIVVKRVMLKRTPIELSPNRALNMLFSVCLNLPTKEKPVSVLDKKETGTFSLALAKKLIPLARKAGIEPENWSVRAETNIHSSTEDEYKLIMPAFVTVTASDNNKNECEFIFEYMATFIRLDSDDYIPMDISPEMLCEIEREPKLMEDMPSMVGFRKCECGKYISDRALKALDDKCPACGRQL